MTGRMTKDGWKSWDSCAVYVICGLVGFIGACLEGAHKLGVL